MTTIDVAIDGSLDLACRAVKGTERIGEEARFELSLFSPTFVEAKALLGKECAITLSGSRGKRVWLGVVTRASNVVTAHDAEGRVVKVVAESSGRVLALRKRTRVYQKKTVAEILRQVFADAGFRASLLDVTAGHSLEKRDYVVQFDELDGTFVRRLCEEEGVYLRHDVRDDEEVYVLETSSSAAPDNEVGHVSLVDDSGLATHDDVAWDCTSERTFRTGHVFVRGYDHEHPATKLQGEAKAGTAAEQAFEDFRAPARLTAPTQEKARAQKILEATRAGAQTVRFRSSAVSLAPGHAFDLTPVADFRGLARPSGKHLVVALQHEWRYEGRRYELAVEAIPLAVPFRLPLVTPRPNLHGVHTATVTGPSGEEIHVDQHGRIAVHFGWDHTGPTDHTSSLPIRVSQPNVPGSMLIPRVGWEVLVQFEDGDADRPVVLGRTYNGKQRPPYALPANKTMTAFGTLSSPGAARKNVISMDDAAGRQHLLFDAGFAFNANIGNNMKRTIKSTENHTVGGDQFLKVGADLLMSIADVVETTAAEHKVMVGAMQLLRVGGVSKITLSNEIVLVRGLVGEQVGNPVTGFVNLGLAAAAGFLGAKLGGAKGWVGKAGPFVAKIAGAFVGYAVADYKSQGKDDHGAAGWALATKLGGIAAEVAGLPGGEGIAQEVDRQADRHVEAAEEEEERKKEEEEATKKKEEEASKAKEKKPGEPEEQGKKADEPPAPAAAGSAQPGGGGPAGGKQGGSAQSGGDGKRETGVRGVMFEWIGGSHGVASGGQIGWSHLGGSVINVGGTHATTTTKGFENKVGGWHKVKAASIEIDASNEIDRKVKTVTTTISGALKREAEEDQSIMVTNSKLTVTLGGKLTIKGKTVLTSGSSTVTVTPNGVLIKAKAVAHRKKATADGASTNK